MSILSASVMALTIFATPAMASDFPTSSDAALAAWKVMNPTTFPVTTASVLEQYDRVAKQEPRLTPEKRARLAAMLAEGSGVKVMVPDGIVIDYLTGRQRGVPHVYEDMRKSLGRDDRALLFDLGDGVTIYWFTGVARQSCNNIAVVVYSPPAPPAPPPASPPPPIVKVRMTPIPSPMLGGQPVILQGFLQNCCCITFTPGLIVGGTNHMPQKAAFIRNYDQ